MRIWNAQVKAETFASISPVKKVLWKTSLFKFEQTFMLSLPFSWELETRIYFTFMILEGTVDSCDDVKKSRIFMGT